MASDEGFLKYVLDRLSGVGEITVRPMMGEYILYCRGVVVGGIYDDRLLVKPTKSARALLPDAPFALPYPGAKEMLLVEELDDPALPGALISAIAADLSVKNRGKDR